MAKSSGKRKADADDDEVIDEEPDQETYAKAEQNALAKMNESGGK